MSITPQDFINSAEKLLDEDLEINYRNAASRAYQGAHHACRRLQKNLGLGPLINVPEREGSHKKLIRNLQQTPLPPTKNQEWVKVIHIRQIGHMLSSARDLRHAADYGLDKSFPRKKARQLIVSSQIILHQVKLLLGE
jgi:uncharacterized protein (UPF0332 family)